MNFYKHSLLNKYSETIQPPPIIKEWKNSKNQFIKSFRRIEIMHKFIKNCKKAEIESVKKSIVYGKPEEINYHDISTTLIEPKFKSKAR
ncbi:MAG: hypothetical protein LBR15_00465 [Methanobrevibacter sp.]|jgi:hypothetical protein|nr:hypothetical protein [Candidatus Methanovirga australis]